MRAMRHSPATSRAARVRAALLAFTAASLLAGLTPAAAAPAPVTQVRVDFEGGYVPLEYLYTRMPATLLVGDRLYVGGVVPAVYPGPAVMPVEERTVNRTTAVRRAKAVFDALRTPAGGWGNPPVADAPTVAVTVTVAGRTRSASVPALGIDRVGPGMTGAQSAARAKLRRALDALDALSGRGVPYRPRLLEAWVLPELGTRVGSPILTPGNSEGEPLPWPAGVPARAGCNVMEAGLLPAGASQASRFVVADGTPFTAVFRPVLPGEKACRRAVR